MIRHTMERKRCWVLAGRIGALVGGAMLVGAVVNQVRAEGLAWDGDDVPAVAGAYEAQAIIPGVARVETAGVVVAAYRTGTATFVDARTSRDFAKGHVAGAVSLPSSKLDARRAERAFAWIVPGLPVVIYCDRPSCPSANRVARFLRSHGFEQLQVYVPGWHGLQGHDVDIERGTWCD